MKTTTKKIITIIAIFCFTLSFVSPTVFADTTNETKNPNIEECSCGNGKKGTRPKTTIIGQGNTEVATGCECGNGESIMAILKLVVDIMSIGVGILGVIGISITGIQYLTAGGNEEQVRKAKRRIFEIVIGIAVYAVIVALLNWLLPAF